MFWAVGDFASLATVVNSGGGCVSMSDCFRTWRARLHCVCGGEVIEEQEDGDQQMVHQTQSRGNTGQEAGGLKKRK